jgi:diguanylate cyclase (GGDEF)-like protein
VDEDIKNYADTLYQSARKESAATLGDDRRKTLQQRSLHTTPSLPLSGVDIQAMIRLYDAHIERSMTARFQSFKQACDETGSVPSSRDFTYILDQCKKVRVQEIKHAATAINEFIRSHGSASVPTDHIESQLGSGSARGHDRVLEKWQIWKAKAQLKKTTTVKTEERERQRDVLLPIYNKAEFLLDVPAFTSKSSTDASPLGLVFMDLDNFSSINDEQGGHEIGDPALQGVAQVVLKVSSGKGCAYRYGGDELCVLLPNHSLDEAFTVAERICREVSAIKIDELPNGLSVSVGVACLPESTDDPGSLVSVADAAMYKSKKAGGNRVSKA